MTVVVQTPKQSKDFLMESNCTNMTEMVLIETEIQKDNDDDNLDQSVKGARHQNFIADDLELDEI